MKLALLVFAFVIVGIVTYFSTVSTRNEKRLGPAAVATIKNGVTSKLQVQALLGVPQSAEKQIPIRQPAGAEPLPTKYTATEIWAYWSDDKKKSLVKASAGSRPSRFMAIIYFDERGIVLDCQTEASEI